MTLSERLAEYIRACFTVLWIEPHEQADAPLEITQLCARENWHVATWDIDRGFSMSGQTIVASDPLAAIWALGGIAQPDGTMILVLPNFHRFLQSAEVVQILTRQILAGKQNRTFVVVLAPVVSIPVELEKLFVVLEHDLPDLEQLADVARGIGAEETSSRAVRTSIGSSM